MFDIHHFTFIIIQSSLLKNLAQYIEALVFATDSPVSVEEIRLCLDETFETTFQEEDVIAAVEAVKNRYALDESGVELVEIAGGLQFMTKGAYHAVIATWLKQTTKKRLSQAAIETLSIIAYKQPVSKTEMEFLD